MRFFLLVFSFTSLACGSEPPMPPERELAKIAWELMAPLDSSIECKKIGDALEPWLQNRSARFTELVGQVTKLTGADANNIDRVEMKLKQTATHCVNPKGPRMTVNVHDERVEKVVKMFPKMKLGFEMR